MVWMDGEEGREEGRVWKGKSEGEMGEGRGWEMSVGAGAKEGVNMSASVYGQPSTRQHTRQPAISMYSTIFNAVQQRGTECGRCFKRDADYSCVYELPCTRNSR